MTDIKTQHVLPPIPNRGADWSAVDRDTYDGPGSPVGIGSTERAAVEDLTEQLTEKPKPKPKRPVIKRRPSRARAWERQRKRAAGMRQMRQCALPGCDQAFYPLRAWQKFHDLKCAYADRKRRERERFRKLKALDGGKNIVKGLGGRKVTRRGSREITGKEADLLAKLRQDPEIHSMVESMLEDTPRNRSPEYPDPAPAAPPSPGLIIPSHRQRNMRRVHPRSLEKM